MLCYMTRFCADNFPTTGENDLKFWILVANVKRHIL